MKKLIAISCLSLLLSACASQTIKESGQDYHNGNYSEAMTRLTPLAEKGNPRAQYNIGYMYYYGQGVPMNKALGEIWIGKAAAQGYAPAMKAQQVIKSQSQLNPINSN